MLYNSYVFILAFLPIVLIGYYTFNYFQYYKGATMWLCLASLFFYGFFNWSYLPIILLSIAINFTLSRLIRPKKRVGGGIILSDFVRKVLMIIGLICNFGALFYFKYYDFLISNINSLFGTDFVLLNLLLPLGISFFTFQQVSYILDCYHGDVPFYSLSEYALFVTFFPQLIAGPIVLHNEMIPQFMNSQNRRFQADNFAKGLMAFGFGLAKKVLLADTFAKAVDVGFSNVEALGTVNALIVMLCYTFQIYFDFSGYCDMATGIGKFFNIDIPMNFNSPYRAKTITEFWGCWHMTLTRFFTTYVYIPLGGNRKGKLRTYFNVMIVFFVSGIWHGANWTFILWGIMHGAASVVTRIFKKQIAEWHPAFSWLCTFSFVNVAWIFFRADSISQAVTFLRQIYNLNIVPIMDGITDAFVLPEFRWLLEIIGKGGYDYLLWVGFIIFGLFACLQMKNTNERLDTFRAASITAFVSGLLTAWAIVSLSGVSVFLYWNF